jgi:hypothetical protein
VTHRSESHVSEDFQISLRLQSLVRLRVVHRPYQAQRYAGLDLALGHVQQQRVRGRCQPDMFRRARALAKVRVWLQRNHLQSHPLLANEEPPDKALPDLSRLEHPATCKVRYHGVHLQLLCHLARLHGVAGQLCTHWYLRWVVWDREARLWADLWQPSRIAFVSISRQKDTTDLPLQTAAAGTSSSSAFYSSSG